MVYSDFMIATNGSTTLLGKLLAKENITVVYGPFKTASFNMKTRVLQMPTWKDVSQDVKDLLVSHEVGHALYTPVDFTKVLTDRKINHTVYNIVEDARIEQLIQIAYPGLAANYSQGYRELRDSGLFGNLTKETISQAPLLDRLNLKFKLRSLIVVEFTREEQEIFNQIDKARTNEEVYQACIDLQNLIRAQRQQIPQPKPQPQPEAESVPSPSSETTEDEFDATAPSFDGSDEDETEDTSSGDDSDSGSESSEEGESTKSSSSEAGESEAGESEAGESEEGKSEEDGESTSDATDGQDSENDSSEADQGASSAGTSAGEQIDDLDSFSSDTQSALDEMKESNADTRVSMPFISFSRSDRAEQIVNPSDWIDKMIVGSGSHEAYNDFVKTNNPLIRSLKMQFERQQKAKVSQRTRLGDCGSINPAKLSQYRFDEKIFNTIEILPNGKNHALIFILDFSGSMQGSPLHYSIQQIIILTKFCKSLSIPFKVFGYTSSYGSIRPEVVQTLSSNMQNLNELSIMEFLSSDMPKTQYESRMVNLFAASFDRYNNQGLYMKMGGTPTAKALLAISAIIKPWLAKQRVQSVHTMLLTDGDSDYIYSQFDSLRVGSRIEHLGKTYIAAAGGNNASSRAACDIYKDQIRGTFSAYYLAADKRSAGSAARHKNDYGTFEIVRTEKSIDFDIEDDEHVAELTAKEMVKALTNRSKFFLFLKDFINQIA